MSTYEVALQFEDGVTKFIKVMEGEALSDAAYRQKINIPLDCRDGACGTCRAFCEEGRYEMDEDNYIEDALTDEEAQAGYILACQCIPQSNGVYQIQSTSEICKTTVHTYEAMVSSLDKVSDSTFVLQLELKPEQENLSFLPGQYINLKVPETEETRSYSFSSIPGSNLVEFVIRNVPEGLMSSYLESHPERGTPFEFTGPYGSFYLRSLTKPALFLAGGTGIAPFLSMLETLVLSDNEQPVNLVYGVTNEADLVGVERLEEIRANHQWFDYRIVVFNATSEGVRQGYVMEHIEMEWVNDPTFDLYLCGPIPMVDSVQKWLKEKGVEPVNFYYERFTPNV